MDAGLLDQRILIETPNTAEDANGQDGLTWDYLAEVWAQAVEGQGREFLKGSYQAEEKIAFRIRWLAVDSTARVTWAERVWRIAGVTGTFHQGERWLHCIATDGPN